MNKLPVIVLGAAVAALIGAVALQQQVNAELRAEIATLRAELQSKSVSSTPGKALTLQDLENVRSESRAEIARLRDELASAQKPVTNKAEKKAVKEAAASNPLSITPVNALTNEGRTTPSLALKTLVWAAAGGDVDALAGTIALDPEAQAKAQALYDRLPDATKAQYGSPEKLVALFIAKDVAVVSGLQVTNEDVSGNKARVGVLFQNSEGKMKQDNFGFRQDSDGWRLAVSAKAIDKFNRVLGGGK